MRILLGLLLCGSAMAAAAEARLLSFNWVVKREVNLDNKLVIAINGESPGPIIRAQQGDTIVVKVTNSLAKENLAIRWDGLRQIGTPRCDGPNGPISAGETCTYRFVADRAGEYSYQSEYRMQKGAGLQGLIQVLP